MLLVPGGNRRAVTAGPPVRRGEIVSTVRCPRCRWPVYLSVPTVPPMTDLAALGPAELAPTVELDCEALRAAVRAHWVQHDAH